ncbi:MAG: methylenetetrahydrofolate reductase [Eubacteriales bacterium]|nr:methylenetetrahydrofolate reductase [Eubacteriales bacterium]
MKLCDRIQQKRTLSFEVYPPKADKPLEPLMRTLSQLYALTPDFISCTYGAMGSNKGRNLEIVSTIQANGGCEALSHYTCIGNSKADVSEAIEEYRNAGVENILALRGDFPAGVTHTQGDFAHANDLIKYICAKEKNLCIAAACYPEKHLLADSLEKDIDALLYKQDAGASFFITQFCFNVDSYLRFLEHARKRGVTLPILVGVLPLLNKEGLVRMTLSNGCSLPAEVSALVGRFGNDEKSFQAAGHSYTVELVSRYMKEGADGIHLYTLNRYEDVSSLVADAGLRTVQP